MRALIVLALLGGPAAADCVTRLEAAKATLIEKGFRPTADGDTAKWLVVSGDATEASMGVEMGGADSAHTGYWVSVETSSAKPADWHGRKRALCCDDNHEASDHIIRFTWEKTTKRGLTAHIQPRSLRRRSEGEPARGRSVHRDGARGGGGLPALSSCGRCA